MDGKVILLRNHVVTYEGKEYTLLPGTVLLVKDWSDLMPPASDQDARPSDKPQRWGMEGIMGRRP